jgi:hypothetical protein
MLYFPKIYPGPEHVPLQVSMLVTMQQFALCTAWWRFLVSM